MNPIQSQIISNFSSLFGRYKAVVTENERTTKITVDNKTVEINRVRSTQSQQQNTRL